MPLTQHVTTRNLGVAPEYASFAVPLGATTKMDGCAAVYPSLAAIFVAQFFAVDLSLSDYLLIAFVSVHGSTATAGLTGAVQGEVSRMLRIGFEVRVTVLTDDGQEVTVTLTRTHARALGIEEGQHVWLTAASGATTVPAMRAV